MLLQRDRGRCAHRLRKKELHHSAAFNWPQLTFLPLAAAWEFSVQVISQRVCQLLQRCEPAFRKQRLARHRPRRIFGAAAGEETAHQQQ